MTDLRSQLQHTLGNTYTLERELGGGGMSRVFVAEDATLGRQVVVKVLSPDLAAGLNRRALPPRDPGRSQVAASADRTGAHDR